MPDMLHEFRQLHEHLAWADRRLLAAMQSPNVPAEAIRELAHVIGADEIWLSRLTDRPSKVPVWPETDLAGLATLIAVTHADVEQYLATLTEPGLSRIVSYKNSAGAAFSNSVQEILRHVLMHAHYHRGKVNLLLKQAGITPAPVDYIFFLRGVPAAVTRVPG
jgi:uncharacterized damage-inducible protein DinB